MIFRLYILFIFPDFLSIWYSLSPIQAPAGTLWRIRLWSPWQCRQETSSPSSAKLLHTVLLTLIWHQQKSGQPPKVLIYKTSQHPSGIPDQFRDTSSGSDYTLTISWLKQVMLGVITVSSMTASLSRSDADQCKNLPAGSSSVAHPTAASCTHSLHIINAQAVPGI